MTERIEVTKLEAARRQLETAARLYFADGDPVSIHTLTAAAHQVIADISKKRGGPSMMIDRAVEKLVRPERRHEARQMLRAATNFLKHADKDPEASLSLLMSRSQFLLFDAAVQYRELTGELVPLLGIYVAWWWLGPGRAFVDPQGGLGIDKFRHAFAGATKERFLADALQILAEGPLDPRGSPLQT